MTATLRQPESSYGAWGYAYAYITLNTHKRLAHLVALFRSTAGYPVACLDGVSPPE